MRLIILVHRCLHLNGCLCVRYGYEYCMNMRVSSSTVIVAEAVNRYHIDSFSEALAVFIY